jgi:NADPH2:quinone reductase
MSRAVIVRQNGGPEVLKLEEREIGAPGPGQVRMRHEAIGLNFIDVYFRTGLYKLDLPFVPGIEGAGIVEAVGEGVTDLRPGDRVGYSGPAGAYADERLVPADRVVKLPDGVSTEMAAAIFSKAATAHFLVRQTFEVKPGDTILVHAASGGVGSLLVQWGSALGATVIALAGSDEKVAGAKANSAAHAFNSREADWVAKVREATGGRGVDVVYDGVGKATFENSLDCLRPRGLMVSFGNASGPVSIPSLGILATKGSLYVTRPTSGNYSGDRASLLHTMGEVFEALEAGHIRPAINQRFALADVQQAHRALEARETTGMTLLIP